MHPLAVLIVGGALVAWLKAGNKLGESPEVLAIRDHDRVASAQMLLRAWLSAQGVQGRAYTGDPWPSRPGLGKTGGEANGDPDDPVFRDSLKKFQQWAHKAGYVFRPKGALKTVDLRQDGLLDTATMSVLSAHSALSDTMPATPASAAVPVAPAAVLPYQPGVAYYIAYAPGTLDRIQASWSPTPITMPDGTTTKLCIDPTHPQAPDYPPPPPTSPASWVAALHQGQIIAVATYKGAPNAPANPSVHVYGVFATLPVAPHPAALPPPPPHLAGPPPGHAPGHAAGFWPWGGLGNVGYPEDHGGGMGWEYSPWNAEGPADLMSSSWSYPY